MRAMSILLCLAVALFETPAVAEGSASGLLPEFGAERRVDGASALGSAATAPAPAFLAQVPEDAALQSGEIEARIAELENRRAEIRTRGPRAAVITGSIMTGAGFGLAALAGILCAAASSGSSTTCNGDNAAGLAAGGGLVGVAGLVTLLTGQAKLKERRRERDALEREIESLQRQKADSRLPSVSFGVGRDFEPGLVLGWRF